MKSCEHNPDGRGYYNRIEKKEHNGSRTICTVCGADLGLLFEGLEVEASSVSDFLDRYYKHERYRERGEEYAAAVLRSSQEQFDKHGYTIASRHESVTGKVVCYRKK